MRKFTFAIIFVIVFIKRNATAIDNVESWTGKWFPEKPSKVKTASKDLDELFGNNNVKTSNTMTNEGKSFPQNPLGKEIVGQNKTASDKWSGNWFPRNPSNASHGVKGTVEEQKNINNKSWNGIWFPQTPSAAFENTVKSASNSYGLRNNETWMGNWFPTNTLNTSLPEKTRAEVDNKPWNGIWFPASPSSELVDLNRVPPLVSCDNGKDNIDIDFDPENRRHGHKYLCLDFKAKYEPSYSINPTQRKFTIPTAYEAPSYCLNETINYEERLPTFGAHRHIPPKYGEFKYLPVQRWLHGLEKGAIVMLYHPCANRMEVEKLRDAVRACLYRHLISPSTLLLPERPLALVAWGTSLEMSVVHLPVVVDFIKENAKHGPQTMNNAIQTYQAGFLLEAKLVTDESDSVLCPNFNL